MKIEKENHGNETEGSEASEHRFWTRVNIGPTDPAPDNGTSEAEVPEADSQKEVIYVLPSESPDSERPPKEDDSFQTAV